MNPAGKLCLCYILGAVAFTTCVVLLVLTPDTNSDNYKFMLLVSASMLLGKSGIDTAFFTSTLKDNTNKK